MNAPIFLRTASRLLTREACALALVLGIFLGVASATGNTPSVLGQSESEAPQSCAIEEPQIGAEPFARTELFFGTAKPDGTAVTDAEWRAFLNDEITPRFPDGLTVLSGLGQWQEADDDIVQERSMLVILLYPPDAAADSSAKIEQIRTAYEQTFQQESVLRSDDSRPVCTSF